MLLRCRARSTSKNCLMLAVVLALASFASMAEEAATTQPAEPLRDAHSKKHGTLFESVLELNRVQEPELNSDDMRKAFDDLIARVRPDLEKATTPREKIAVLNKFLLAERNVSYLSNLYWRDATLAASLLRKQGNCLSTSTLYLLAGEALDLPIHMVVVPLHAFARWDDGHDRINIETTFKGVEHPDAFYVQRVSQPAEEDVAKLGWCRSMSGDEVLAELHVIAAHHREGENNLEDALKHWDEALRLAPARSDYTVRRLALLANFPGKRDEARAAMIRVARHEGEPPPTVVTEALMYLARDAASDGNHERERVFLMAAFVEAPKPMQLGVLSKLAFCLRALKDYNGALRYIELAAALKPKDANMLYSLAIMQRNFGDLKSALATIDKGLAINPESWHLQMLKAGYLFSDGQTERGVQLFETIQEPRAAEESWKIMQAWFWAECRETDAFFVQFELALDAARSPHILEWIDQDPALDYVRGEAKFKALVAKHRERLTGKK